MIDDDAKTFWVEYVRAEREQVRAVTMQALDRFIVALLRHDTATWHDWALDLARATSDGASDIPVRFPLFHRVLLPALADGVLKKRAGCARWLAHFGAHLGNAKDAALPDALRSPSGLLKEALRADPGDQKARRQLVQQSASYLAYTLHELPAGVLYGHNGASIPECDELLELLAEFSEHVELLNEQPRYAELVGRCRRHFLAYRAYLAQARPGNSYERFLTADEKAESRDVEQTVNVTGNR